MKALKDGLNTLFTVSVINKLTFELLIFSIFAFMPNNIFLYCVAVSLIVALVTLCLLNMFYKVTILNADEEYPLFSRIISKIMLYSIFGILIYVKEYVMFTFLIISCSYITIILKKEKTL
jgi:hypothetical protein